MRMLNQAYEDARAFEEFQRKLGKQPVVLQKQAGESRRDFRKRCREAAKQGAKVIK